jgi:hypothetical protein
MQGTSKYINIKEASQLTGKHPDTIRRLWQDDKGQVIVKIQAKYTQRDKQNRLLIDREWLLSHYKPLSAPTNTSYNENEQTPTLPQNNQLDTLIAALQKQLDAKDSQILGLQQIIHDKEANTTKLQDQFQQLLATQQLPAQAQDTASYAPTQAEVVITEVEVPMQAPETPKQTPKKPRKKTKAKPKTKAKTKTADKKASEPEQTKKSWWRR